MSAGRFLVASLALAAAVAGHPAANRDRREAEVAATVVDAEVSKPTVKSEMVAWVDEAGNPTHTAVADVLAVPSGFRALPAGFVGATPAAAPGPGTTPFPIAGGALGAGVGAAQGLTPGLTPGGSIATPVPIPSPADGAPFPGSAPGAGLGSGVPIPPAPGSSSPMPGTPASSPISHKPGSGASAGFHNNSSHSDRFGISYAPYRANHDCKSPEDISDDLSRLAGLYSTLRIYGTDCDQVKNVVDAAQGTGMKLFLGIWDITQVEKEADLLVDGVAGNWDQVRAISVGNELVNSGQASPAEVIGAVQQARQILRARGYQGPVVTVDTFVATEENPELCDESDFCAINAHAFFDSTVEASRSGQWLADTVGRVRSKLASSEKKIVVTETGWPIQGVTNGMAVPSLQNQRAALGAIRSTFSETPEDVILFSAFNDGWKARDMLTFMADPYFGIDGAVSRCDQ